MLLAVSAIGALSFAVLFRAPKRYLHHTVILGCLASILINHWRELLGQGLATFYTAFIVGALGLALGRLTGKPAQGFLIPSIIFLVPGVRIYQAVDYALHDNYAAAGETMFGALMIVVAISFALLLVNWLIPIRRAL